MKFPLLVAISMVGACSPDAVTETPIVEDVAPGEPDAFIKMLRTYNDFPVIVEGRGKQAIPTSKPVDFDGSGLKTAVYSLSQDVTWMETTVKVSSWTQAYSRVATTNTINSLSDEANYDHWFTMPYPYVAVGVAGTSNFHDWTRIGLNYRVLGQNGVLSNESFHMGKIRGVGGTVSTDLTWQDGWQFYLKEKVVNRVVVGIGLRVGSGQARTIWMYTAPYDPVQKKIIVNVPNDINIVAQIDDPGNDIDRTTEGSISPSLDPQFMEMAIRTFDGVATKAEFEMTFVTGYAARTYNDDVKNVALATRRLISQ